MGTADRWRLGVDFHVAAGRPQGSRRHLEDLYAAVLRRDDAPDITLLVEGAVPSKPAWAERAAMVSVGEPSRARRLLIGAERAAKSLALDALHFQYVSPPLGRTPTVLTIHDILFSTHPDLFRARDRAWLGPLVKASARRAAQVLVVSEFTRQAVVERYRLPPSRVHLVSNGVDSARFSPGDATAARAQISARYGFGEWITCVGRVEPRKNHRVLLDVLQRRRARGAPLPTIAIAGALDPGSEPLRSAVAMAGFAEQMRFLGPIPDDDVVALYRGGMCAVYPSFAEGFGLPPLEALSCGAAVIASNATALPEVLGDAAWLVAPDDAEAWDDAIETVLTDSDRRATLASRGRARAAMYSWETSAGAFIAALGQQFAK